MAPPPGHIGHQTRDANPKNVLANATPHRISTLLHVLAKRVEGEAAKHVNFNNLNKIGVHSEGNGLYIACMVPMAVRRGGTRNQPMDGLYCTTYEPQSSMS